MVQNQIVSTLKFFGIKEYDGRIQEGRFAAFDRDSLCTDQINNTSSKSWTKSSYVIISENANHTLDECKEKWRELNKKLSYLYARYLIIEDSGAWRVFDNTNHEIILETLFPDFFKVLAADEGVRDVAYKIFCYLCSSKPVFFENEICNKLTKSTSSSYTGSLYSLPSFSILFNDREGSTTPSSNSKTRFFSPEKNPPYPPFALSGTLSGKEAYLSNQWSGTNDGTNKNLEDLEHFIKKCDPSYSIIKKNEVFAMVTGELGNDSVKSPKKKAILPHQIIYFGAPGTGKSHTIDDDPIIKALPKENKVRTMFHPESDYASFVGCYKPVMEKPAFIGKEMPVGKPVDSCILVDEHQEDANSDYNTDKYLPLYLFSHNDCLNLENAVKTRREEIAYKFTPQAFTKAYVQAWKEYFSAPECNLPYDVYLIIEEINRGNCAQIFGNLFQLLDRDDENFSKYAIDTEYDLKKYLKEELKDKSGKLLFDVFSSNSDFNSWTTNNDKESIVKGETLCLPPNLYLVASMNTSDQGLFPMDSAFKRRWQWQYIPVKNEGKGHKIVLNEITGVSTGIMANSVGATLPLEYDWWSFLENVNFKIEDANSSSDKKLGYWFVQPAIKGSTEIDIETFTCKVISYLWNDVFKNVPEGDLNIFTFEYLGSAADPRTKRGTHPFDSFFDPLTGLIDTQMVKDFLGQDKMDIIQVNLPKASNGSSLGESEIETEQIPNDGSEKKSPSEVPQVEEPAEKIEDQE